LLEPLPNHFRALPNKLFDYLAHGVPVFVPDYPAMGPIVRKGPCGWTLPKVRGEFVISAIREARSSGEGPARGRAGREAYEKIYAWDNQSANFLSIVRSLTAVFGTC